MASNYAKRTEIAIGDRTIGQAQNIEINPEAEHPEIDLLSEEGRAGFVPGIAASSGRLEVAVLFDADEVDFFDLINTGEIVNLKWKQGGKKKQCRAVFTGLSNSHQAGQRIQQTINWKGTKIVDIG